MTTKPPREFKSRAEARRIAAGDPIYFESEYWNLKLAYDTLLAKLKEVEQENKLFRKVVEQPSAFLIAMDMNDNLTARLQLAEEVVEALESARGWVVTHAMQTYSKVADKEVQKIDELIAKWREGNK